MRVLDLFSGIGGFSLGLERAGMTTVAFCEIEPYCQAVLRKHWPKVPIYDDVKELSAERLARDGISVDLICGGFPCQDISVAGKGAGLAGERSGLWSEFARLIGEIRPRRVVVENVAALTFRGLLRVLGDFAEIGYDAEWHLVPASLIGSPHKRDRTYIVAYPNGQGGEGLVARSDFGEAGSWRWSGKEDLQLVADCPFSESDMWPQPLVRRMDDGLHSRVDRLKALGNAVVPQVIEIIGKAIMRKDV